MWDYLEPISLDDKRQIETHINKYIYGIKLTPNQLRTAPLPEAFENLLEKSETLNEWFYNPVDRSECDMKIANALQINNFSREEAYNIMVHTHKGQERGENYVIPLVDKIYDNPMTVLDDNYEEIQAAISEEQYYDELAKENKYYKIEQENIRVKEAKESSRLQGKYTLHGFEEELADYYIQEMLDEVSQMNDRLTFISPNLTKVVPLYGVNVILIAGKSGRGKSSVMANITEPIITNGGFVACISTEEKARSIALRTVCLQLGLNYNTRRHWLSDKLDVIKPALQNLFVESKLKIYDSYTYGKDLESGAKVKALEMTSREGIQMALIDIEKSARKPDVIMLDYITKVSTSTKNNKLQEWQVMTACCADVEEWSKRTGIPAIIFTQLEVLTFVI
jgi:archaellum biogenesis ATPase FlaH